MGQEGAGEAPDARLPLPPLIQYRGRCRTRLEEPEGGTFLSSPSSEGSDNGGVEEIWWREQRRAKIPAVRTRRPPPPPPWLAQARETALERTLHLVRGVPHLAAMERKGECAWPFRFLSPFPPLSRRPHSASVPSDYRSFRPHGSSVRLGGFLPPHGPTTYEWVSCFSPRILLFFLRYIVCFSSFRQPPSLLALPSPSVCATRSR